ncbi:alpha/beta fold hydrolase [Neobacillus notoginsengisoli]|uniref:alpha/beta fold hydrolase n=1 Tax=Neobacillus notoginsengisoli TaxID=1578198 RepID=UPI0030844ACC
MIRNERIGRIPVLEVVKEEKQNDQMPMVLFVHGFTSAKENNLHIAYLLARSGFRAVLPDAPFHGERSKGLSEEDLSARFWDIVIKTIEEVNTVKNYFVQKGLASSGQIGLAGTSMGGIVTLGSLTQYDWINTAVSLMGSPNYHGMAGWQIDELRKQGYQLPYSEEEIHTQLEALKAYDLTLKPEKLAGRPLMFWHGEADTIVPHHYAWSFYETLLADPEREGDLAFVSEKHVGHKVTQKGIYALVDWFTSHLGARKEKEALVAEAKHG